MIIQKASSLDTAKAAAATLQNMFAFALCGAGLSKDYAFANVFKYLESHREACTNTPTSDMSIPDIPKLHTMLYTTQILSASSTQSKSISSNSVSKSYTQVLIH
jgi:hypothetical protein